MAAINVHTATAGRQRIVRFADRTLAMRPVTAPGHLILGELQAYYPDVEGYPAPLHRVTSPFEGYVLPPLGDFEGFPLDTPTTLAGFGFSLVARSTGGGLPPDFQVQGRAYVSPYPDSLGDPYGDWQVAIHDPASGFYWGDAQFRSTIKVNARPFEGGTPPHGYIRLIVRGSFPSSADTFDLLAVVFNFWRRA